MKQEKLEKQKKAAEQRWKKYQRKNGLGGITPDEWSKCFGNSPNSGALSLVGLTWNDVKNNKGWRKRLLKGKLTPRTPTEPTPDRGEYRKYVRWETRMLVCRDAIGGYIDPLRLYELIEKATDMVMDGARKDKVLSTVRNQL